MPVHVQEAEMKDVRDKLLGRRVHHRAQQL